VRVIDSRLKNEVTDTYAVHEARADGGTKYYTKDYKRTATLTFAGEAVAVASSARDGFVTVPSFEEYQCSVVVPGRPFVGSDGRGLLAPQCAGARCEGRDASWSGGTTARAPSVGNATSDDDLGGEWTRNALGEHASVASFAAFSIALMRCDVRAFCFVRSACYYFLTPVFALVLQQSSAERSRRRRPQRGAGRSAPRQDFVRHRVQACR
jgi:hypothetical protein